MRLVIDISEHDKEWIGNAYGIPQDINTKIAEAIINAEPCHTEPHWIPVTERLPEESGLYQVTDRWGNVVRYVFNTNGGSVDYWKRCVKAWMPLPEPYKGVAT